MRMPEWERPFPIPGLSRYARAIIGASRAGRVPAVALQKAYAERDCFAGLILSESVDDLGPQYQSAGKEQAPWKLTYGSFRGSFPDWAHRQHQTRFGVGVPMTKPTPTLFRIACALVALGAATSCGRTVPGDQPGSDGGRFDAAPPPAPGYPRVSVGGQTSCSIDRTGRLVCWGAFSGTSLEPPDGVWADLSFGHGAGWARSGAGAAALDLQAPGKSPTRASRRSPCTDTPAASRSTTSCSAGATPITPPRTHRRGSSRTSRLAICTAARFAPTGRPSAGASISSGKPTLRGGRQTRQHRAVLGRDRRLRTSNGHGRHVRIRRRPGRLHPPQDRRTQLLRP